MQKWSMRQVPSLQEIGGPVDGLVCIITGPTSGIGKQTAIELARRGAHGPFSTYFVYLSNHYTHGTSNSRSCTLHILFCSDLGMP